MWSSHPCPWHSDSGVYMPTATAWGTEGPERQEVAEPAKRKVEAETRCISGHTQKPATSGYAQTPATLRYIPTHATSGCSSGGKPEARREARCRPARCPVFDSWSIPPAGAGLLTRCRRSTRRGGDRYRSGRGGQQKRGVVHSHSHGDVPYPSRCFARHEPGPAVIELPSATYRPLTCQDEYGAGCPTPSHTPTSRRSDAVRTGLNSPAR
jgi:hypothetical protein